MPTATPEITWLDARETVTLTDLSQVCGLSADELDELMEYGALVPLGPLVPVQTLCRFSADWVTPLRTASRLRRDFDLDLFSMGMLLGYLNRIEAMEREMRALRAQVPSP